jgi:hypothetical protein
VSYRAEADALDAEILSVIERWSAPPGHRGHWEYSDPDFEFDFNDLALRIFEHQSRFNEPYARYCASLGVTNATLPARWQEIPLVAAAAFKETALCTFDPSSAEIIFETSGTTTGSGGIHYMEDARLYDASLIAGFDYGVLRDTSDPLRYCMLLASPAQSPRSSLSYMMNRAAKVFGDGAESWYFDGGKLEAGRFIEDIRKARNNNVPVCIAGTAFAFVNLLDELAQRQMRIAQPLPSGSRIMETGGFKGRARAVERIDLYKQLGDVFGLPPHHIIGEYGMTELSSQYYDVTYDVRRSKDSPPWLRSYAVDENGNRLPAGVVGALVHVDLANRSSCVAIQTEDLGAVLEDGGIVLIGREQGAELRGCSLDAESLRVAIS